MRKEKIEELHQYIDELTTIKQTLLSSQVQENETKGFLSTEKYQCELKNGQVVTREKMKKGGSDGDAAIILPVTTSGNVLLIVQPRVFTKRTVCVELPAGYIEKGENPMMAGARELAEETGYVPEKMQFLSSYYQDQGCGAAYIYSYLALDCKKTKPQQLDKDEFIRYFECRYEEALELLETGYITDVNSQYALEKSKTYFKNKSYGNL